MKKSKLLLTFIIVLCCIISFSGCTKNKSEAYNNKDLKDFNSGTITKFKVIQFKNIIDKETLKESQLNGSFFICAGSVSGSSKESSGFINKYYMYVQNKNGGIYFADISSDQIRIYEDATTSTPYLIGYSIHDLDEENQWDDYEMFNLHIPKGTIIPKVKYNFDVNNIKKK